ncbi:hypothetical protein Nepgr_012019 [Nepenthes gracilis]|uniref:Uncharacterized protein n=1 Tax=Nepenthes gracilis TaxID=150966 RepID=A0AAD3SFD2_NEPGR|nr:hypothetical protein Nepgr_012019 [Nepenthes gracilis]
MALSVKEKVRKRKQGLDLEGAQAVGGGRKKGDGGGCGVLVRERGLIRLRGTEKRVDGEVEMVKIYREGGKQDAAVTCHPYFVVE